MKKNFFIAIILRLIIILLSTKTINFDINSYLKVGQLIFNKVNIYPDIAKIHYPYFPLYLYFQSLSFLLKKFFYIDQVFFLKSINLVFDVLNLYLIYLLTNKNEKITFLYAINPIIILINFFHGQFDVIVIFFVLLSLFYLIKKRNEALSILSLSLAITFKHWPIIFIIPYIKNLKNKKNLIFILFFPILFITLYSVLFKTKILNIIYPIFGYRSLFSEWGLGKLIYLIFYPQNDQPPIYLQKILLLIFLFTLFFYSLLIKEKNLINYLFKILIFFYSFTVGFSVQYFSWLIPFLTILKPKFLKKIVIFITIYLFFNYLEWFYKNNLLNYAKIFLSLFLWLQFIYIFFILHKKKRSIKT